MVKLLVGDQTIDFETTIFPDGTSQVWKLKELPEDFDPQYDELKILWLFENEGEIVHVCQLANLLEEMFDQESHTLVVPYLPYGRQDKKVGNTASFALHTFTSILYHANICRVETYDAHSSVETETYIESTKPDDFHRAIFNHSVVVFPDKGAADRYGKSDAFKHVSKLYCQKIRDQLTGNILGLELVGEENDLIALNGGDILIVDDICDGGMTFIKVAEAVNKVAAPRCIDLAVTHGLFSKGKAVLHDAGISKIYTTNSLLRNPQGYKIW